MKDPDSKAKFTLIELLVVIAIISILAAMLLPALRNARGMATKATCQGTQKNMGHAHTMYLGDNDDYMADFSPDIYNYTYTAQSWIPKLAPYSSVNLSLVENGTYFSLKPCDNPQVPNVFCCPKRPQGIFGGNYSSFHVSYYLNDTNNARPVKIMKCQRPSQKIYLGDAADCMGAYTPNLFFPNLYVEKAPTYLNAEIEIRHNMTANFLFIDGHVNSYGRGQLPLPSLTWNEGREWIDATYSKVPNNL